MEDASGATHCDDNDTPRTNPPAPQKSSVGEPPQWDALASGVSWLSLVFPGSLILDRLRSQCRPPAEPVVADYGRKWLDTQPRSMPTLEGPRATPARAHRTVDSEKPKEWPRGMDCVAVRLAL